MSAIFDLGKIIFLMLLILACLGCGLVALSGAGLGDKFEAELTQAQAEELKRRAEYNESEAKLARARADADAIRTMADELAKHSRLNRRILTLYTVRSQASTALSLLNILVWGLAMYLYWRQQ